MTLSMFLRLPLEMVKVLAQKVGELLTQDIPAGWFWRGRHVKLVDGTTITLPDTEDNRRYYPHTAISSLGLDFRWFTLWV